MKLYNNFKIKGVLNKIEVRYTSESKPYAFGFVANYTEKEYDGELKKTNYFSISFIAFNKTAEKIEREMLKKDMVVQFEGYLKINNYNNKSQPQLVVTDFEFNNSDQDMTQDKENAYEDFYGDNNNDSNDDGDFNIEDDLPF